MMNEQVLQLVSQYKSIPNEIETLTKGIQENGYDYSRITFIQRILHVLDERIPNYTEFDEWFDEIEDLNTALHRLFKEEYNESIVNDDKELLITVWTSLTDSFKVIPYFNGENINDNGFYEKTYNFLENEKLSSPAQYATITDSSLDNPIRFLIISDYESPEDNARIINRSFLPGKNSDKELTWINKLSLASY